MTDMTTIEERLNTLEHDLEQRGRQLRRHRLALAACLLAVPAAILVAAGDFTRFEQIQLERLEIVNEQGEVVLAASASANGGQLDIWDSGSKNIIRLSSNNQGGDVAIWNKNGSSVAGAWATANGGAVAAWDAEGNRAARMSAGEGHGMLTLHAGTAEPIVQLDGTTQGGRIAVNGNKGNVAYVAEALEHGGTWAIMDHQDNGAIFATTTGTGSQLGLFRPGDETRMLLDTSPDAAALLFENGSSSITLSDSMDRGPGLALSSPVGAVHISGGNENATPGFNLFNAQGHLAARTTLRSSGGGLIQVGSPDGEPVVFVRSDLEGNGRIDLSDRAGHLLATFQAHENTGATLALLSQWGKTLCVLAGTDEGGILNLMNRNGVPVVTSGIARDRRGGSVTVQNERGMTVVSAGSNVREEGQLRLHGPDGESLQVLPGNRR